MAAAAGVKDATPLAPYEIVCGTSIGALNGWFVATGQYTRLKEMWYGISAANLTRLKPQFEAARDPESGILNRFASAIALAGLTKNQGALLQSKPIFDWIVENVDATRPVLLPLTWATTKLTTQRAEYFYVRPPGAPANFSQELISSLRLTLGPHTVVREATPDILHRAIFASACIPLAFDPVVMPGPEGTPCSYCDGGVTANTPIAIAHAVSSAADVILMDPAFHDESDYDDALSIGFGMFGTMQRRLLVTEMRGVYFQSKTKLAFARLTKARMRLEPTRCSKSSSLRFRKRLFSLCAPQKRCRSRPAPSMTRQASVRRTASAGTIRLQVSRPTIGRRSRCKT